VIWLILVIIIVGWAIVSAINRSTETKARVDLYNGMSDEEKAAYNQQQAAIQQQVQTQAMLRKRAELFVHIYQLRRSGKKENGVATNSKVQSLARQSGLVIGSGEDVKTIMMSHEFLEATKLMVKLKNMIGDGLDDNTIAKKLGSGWNPDTNKYTWYKLYKPEDIAVLRDSLTPHKSPHKASSWSEFNKVIDQ
jgi:hypothetical protein